MCSVPTRTRTPVPMHRVGGFETQGSLFNRRPSTRPALHLWTRWGDGGSSPAGDGCRACLRRAGFFVSVASVYSDTLSVAAISTISMELPVDTEEKLLEALEHTKDDLKLTNDEEKRLTKAFKEPEFKKLLGEYMQEISDPKNRAEYEQYIAEQERDKKVPKNMQIIKPKSGFVVKCRKRGPKAADGDRADEKLFINVCSAVEVETPSSSKEKKGMSWSLPHMIGAPHMVQDKSGTPCTTFEVAFNTETLAKCTNPDFKKMVANVAFDAVKTNYKKYAGGNANLADDWKILKSLKAFGGAPGMMSLKKKVEPEAAPAGSTQPKTTGNPKKKKRGGDLKVKPGFLKPKPQKNPDGTEIPKCVIVERGVFDLKDTIRVREADAKRPKDLVCKVSLPKVESFGDIELDVDERTLTIDVPKIYSLKKRLPYPVFGDKGSATWMKSKNELVVTIPVCPPEKIVPSVFEGDGLGEDSMWGEKEDDCKLDDEVASSSGHHIEELGFSPRIQAEDEAAHEESDAAHAQERAMEPSVVEDGTATEEVAAAPAPPTPAASTTPDIPGLSPEMLQKLKEAREAYALWQEKGDSKAAEAEEQRKTKEAEQIAAAKRRAVASAVANNQEQYIPAESFEGSKAGYVFKMGEKGLGYYWDIVSNGGQLLAPVSSAKENTMSNVIQKDDIAGSESCFEMPKYRFRQDKSTMTLLLQVKQIKAGSVVTVYSAQCMHVKFDTDEMTYALKVQAPKHCEIDKRASTFNVSENNMALVVGKTAPGKWTLAVERVPKATTVFLDDAETTAAGGSDDADEDNRPKTVGGAARGKGESAGHAPLANKLFLELD